MVGNASGCFCIPWDFGGWVFCGVFLIFLLMGLFSGFCPCWVHAGWGNWFAVWVFLHWVILSWLCYECVLSCWSGGSSVLVVFSSCVCWRIWSVVTSWCFLSGVVGSWSDLCCVDGVTLTSSAFWCRCFPLQMSFVVLVVSFFLVCCYVLCLGVRSFLAKQMGFCGASAWGAWGFLFWLVVCGGCHRRLELSVREASSWWLPSWLGWVLSPRFLLWRLSFLGLQVRLLALVHAGICIHYPCSIHLWRSTSILWVFWWQWGVGAHLWIVLLFVVPGRGPQFHWQCISSPSGLWWYLLLCLRWRTSWCFRLSRLCGSLHCAGTWFFWFGLHLSLLFWLQFVLWFRILLLLGCCLCPVVQCSQCLPLFWCFLFRFHYLAGPGWLCLCFQRWLRLIRLWGECRPSWFGLCAGIWSLWMPQRHHVFLPGFYLWCQCPCCGTQLWPGGG